MQLKALRRRAGLSVRGMASLLDIPPSSYQYYERGYARAQLPLELSVRLRPLLLERGIASRDIDRLCPVMARDAAPLSWARLTAWSDVVSWPIVGRGTMDESESLPVPGSASETLIALPVVDDDMASVATPGAHVVVDWSDTGLIDGRCYLVRSNGAACIRRYRATAPRFEADRPGGRIVGLDCDVVGRVVYVVRSL